MLKLTFKISVLILFALSCSTRDASSNTYNTKTYSRIFESKKEKIKIDFDRQIFTFFTEINNRNYIANGTLKRRKSEIEFSFPAFSEYQGLSVFPKEFWDLELIDTSEHFEIDIALIDIETKSKLKSYVNIYVSPVNLRTNVRKYYDSRTIIVRSKDSKINLIFERPYKGKDIIEIPQKGKYKLEFNMLSPKTLVFNETTTRGCFTETINPIILMSICQDSIGEIESFSISQNCSDKFILMSR